MLGAHCGDGQRLWCVLLSPAAEASAAARTHGALWAFRMPVPAHLWLKQKNRFLSLTAVVPLVFLQLFSKGHREITFVGFSYTLNDREVTHSLLPNEDQRETFRSPAPAHGRPQTPASCPVCLRVCGGLLSEAASLCPSSIL